MLVRSPLHSDILVTISPSSTINIICKSCPRCQRCRPTTCCASNVQQDGIRLVRRRNDRRCRGEKSSALILKQPAMKIMSTAFVSLSLENETEKTHQDGRDHDIQAVYGNELAPARNKHTTEDNDKFCQTAFNDSSLKPLSVLTYACTTQN